MIKIIVLTVRHLFCFILIVAVFSCENNKPVTKEIATIPVYVNQDSINKIRKEIKAAEKAVQLDALFKNKVKNEHFNGCVLIAQRGQIIYKNAFGFADYKTKEFLKINSAFQLSSTSKPFTATAIMLLMDQGKLKLTDNVQKFFPDFPYPDITIEMLLTHRSGLSNYIYFGESYCDENNCYNGKTFDNNSVLEIMKCDKPATYYAPNKKFGYCNTNYAILASIVEKVSGYSFADFMEQNIFKPLGMSNTWVHIPKNNLANKNITLGHNAYGQIEKDTYADNVVGDKGIYSTVEDVFLFDKALYSEKILKKKTIEDAFTGYSNEHRGKRNYGYGWRLIDSGNGNKIVYHNGWWHGYNSIFFRRLSDQTTVIVLSNKDNRTIYRIEDILSIINVSSNPVEVDIKL
jgi:CubicO group peptidase (beta-lactamase class C family)